VITSTRATESICNIIFCLELYGRKFKQQNIVHFDSITSSPVVNDIVVPFFFTWLSCHIGSLSLRFGTSYAKQFGGKEVGGDVIF
jgi:hypothetical protein